ncbi:MAG: hypothetical protein KGZ25_11570 [Planctomycetes bacterium]|nr:hypothetical protein [Planctomycetota bacterium]
MAQTQLTPEEYELHLEELTARIKQHLESGSENTDKLIGEAEELLELGSSYREVFERHPDFPRLVGGLLARQKQENFMASKPEAENAPGCLLGWLLGRKKSS